jgi:ABC-type amino acid transport substrate-binding protein
VSNPPESNEAIAERQFYLCNGATLKDMHELPQHFDSMSDSDFSHHVNEDKNDFSNWLRDVHGEEELANKLHPVRCRKRSKAILSSHISRSTHNVDSSFKPKMEVRTMRRNMSRGRFLRGVGAGAVTGAVAMGARGVSAHTVPNQGATPVLDRIMARGKVRIGLRHENTMFLKLVYNAAQNKITKAEGLEPELGRAIARAIFGDDNYSDSRIEWVPITQFDDRFVAVQPDAPAHTQADIVFRAATHTIERETGKNVKYRNPDGSTIKTQIVSTTYGLSYYLDGGDVLFNVNPADPKATLIYAGATSTTFSSLQALGYNVQAGGQADYTAARNADPNADVGYASDNTIIQAKIYYGAVDSRDEVLLSDLLGGQFFSQESLGPVMPDGDTLWVDLVNTVISTFMMADNPFTDAEKLYSTPVASHLAPQFTSLVLRDYPGYANLLINATEPQLATTPAGLGRNQVWTSGGVHVCPGPK